MQEKITDYEKEVITGLVLSDGYLSKINNNENSKLIVGTVHREFAYKLRTILPSFSFGIQTKQATSSIRNGVEWNNKESYMVASESNSYFTTLRNKWYLEKNNYKKQVPEDIIITPTVLYYFFIGDGFSTLSAKTNSMRLFLCTDSFNLDSMRLLQQQIKTLNLNFNISCRNKDKQQYRLGLCKKQEILNFYSVIPECNLNCFKYKWKSYL